MAPWDILEKAGNIAQLTGLDVLMLITIIVRLLRITRNDEECEKLEERVRKLRTLLHWPIISYMAPHSELDTGSPLRSLHMALDDADGLADSYRKSTLWRRVVGGRRLATEFNDMHSNIDSCISLVFFATAYPHMQPDPPRTSHVSIGVMHGGPDITDHRVTELSSSADNRASNSPGIHTINIDHEATYKALGTVTPKQDVKSCVMML